MSTRTRFEKEAKGNSEMAYCPVDQLFIDVYCEIKITKNS